MGKKDAYQFDYLDDDGRFADRINGALFCGRQVVKPEELEPDESQDLKGRDEYLSGMQKIRRN